MAEDYLVFEFSDNDGVPPDIEPWEESINALTWIDDNEATWTDDDEAAGMPSLVNHEWLLNQIIAHAIPTGNPEENDGWFEHTIGGLHESDYIRWKLEARCVKIVEPEDDPTGHPEYKYQIRSAVMFEI